MRTALRRHLRHRLQVDRRRQQRARLTSGELVTYSMGEVRVRLDVDERTTVFWAGPPGCRAILGAVALEEFGLAADRRERRLVPGPPALL